MYAAANLGSEDRNRLKCLAEMKVYTCGSVLFPPESPPSMQLCDLSAFFVARIESALQHGEHPMSLNAPKNNNIVSYNWFTETMYIVPLLFELFTIVLFLIKFCPKKI